MTYDMKRINKILIFAMAGVFVAGPAFAQQFKESWSFTPQNRASIAALMKQYDDAKHSSGASATASGPATLVCGGGGSTGSSAAGTASCIILNNSNGSIQIGQESTGDQTSQADDVLNTLNGTN